MRTSSTLTCWPSSRVSRCNASPGNHQTQTTSNEGRGSRPDLTSEKKMSEPSPSVLLSEPDYNSVLRANLEQVFNERNAAKRVTAIDQLFVADPVLFEPTGVVQGAAAISEVAGKLLEQFGPDFSFVPEADAVGHHGLGVLRWRAGPQGGKTVVSGADAAEIVDGRISRLWVLINPSQS